MIPRRILLAEITPGVQSPPQFATWNSADKHADVALSGGDLIATKTATHATQWAGVRGNQAVAVGQMYWETTPTFSAGADISIGMAWWAAAAGWLNGDPGVTVALGRDIGVAINKAGDVRSGGVTLGNAGTVASGAVIRHWLDMDAGIYRIAVNGGAWVAFSGELWFLWPIDRMPVVSLLRPFSSIASCLVNFGQSPFAYAVPDGAQAGIFTQDAPPTPIYLGSEGFDATIDGYPVHFMGRIAGDQDVESEREGSCWVWGGNSISRRGQLVVINNDGALDGWRDYLWRDASVILRDGLEGDAYEDFPVWAFNRVDKMELTNNARIVLSFADPVIWLDRQVQTTLYPPDQANLQLAGQPLPIVYGSPRYCTPVRLDTNPTVRDFQLHDVDSGDRQLAEIAAIFDSGDVFNGPDDAFIPADIITGANGGDFTGNTAAVPPKPLFFSIPTGSGEFGTNDFFFASGGYLHCKSKFAPAVAMEHSSTTLLARTRYRITFTCSGIVTPGSIIFRAPGSQDVSVALTTTGAKSVALYVRDPAKLRLVMQGDGVDVYIHTLRVSAEQVIDWDYWGGTRGFTLENTPYGKIIANPVQGQSTLAAILSDICTRTELPDVTIDGVTESGFDADSAVAMDGLVGREMSAYLDKPMTGLALARDLLAGFCGFITSNRVGRIVAGQIKEPRNTYPEMLTLSPSNIIPDGVSISPDVAKQLTIRLAGGKNYTVHSATDIATGVPTELATELQTEYRHTVEGGQASAKPISSAYAAASAAPVQGTLLDQKNDLRTEANRIATLWRPTRNFYAVTAILTADQAEDFTLEPGATVRLVWPRWGLDDGKNLLIVGIRTRFFSRRVQLKLWG